MCHAAAWIINGLKCGHGSHWKYWLDNSFVVVVVVVVVGYFILSRLLYLAFSANLGLLCMPHLGMGPIV